MGIFDWLFGKKKFGTSNHRERKRNQKTGFSHPHQSQKGITYFLKKKPVSLKSYGKIINKVVQINKTIPLSLDKKTELLKDKIYNNVKK
tara:strand:- start:139 stop:405 length:267 start_codon:yes stop_codon:yes gene_type:complete